MSSRENRTLIAIGGKEDKTKGGVILHEVARHVNDGRLVILTAATEHPIATFNEYERAFGELGLRKITHLKINRREECTEEENVRLLDEAKGIFFTGGDQLRLTSQIGDTPVFQRIQQLYREGAVVAGTSSGAAVLCETMIVSGGSEESHQLDDVLRMAPGLGLIGGMIIDMHFSERGRIGRLIGAVAQNPRVIGLGIDEDTALVIQNEERFSVLGDGAVYVVDGETVTDSNVAEDNKDQTLAIYDVKLHLLSAGHEFDLQARRPVKQKQKARAAERRSK
jgi:cyanophycinase